MAEDNTQDQLRRDLRRDPDACRSCEGAAMSCIITRLAALFAFIKLSLTPHREAKPSDDYLALSDYLNTKNLYEK
jgi:hypothetical protein